MCKALVTQYIITTDNLEVLVSFDFCLALEHARQEAAALIPFAPIEERLTNSWKYDDEIPF